VSIGVHFDDEDTDDSGWDHGIMWRDDYDEDWTGFWNRTPKEDEKPRPVRNEE